MGIDACIETESGAQIDQLLDPENLFSLLLSACDYESSLCLRFIDPYGDTTFNWLQMPFLITAIKSAVEKTSDNLTKNHGEKDRDGSSGASIYRQKWSILPGNIAILQQSP